jgi:antitoxin component YwqK of YwqJK toxin-antitoxin module
MSQNTEPEEDPLVCCICYDEAGEQGFMEPNPCKCTGTIKIHLACYEQVRDEFGKCGICKTLFPKEITILYQDGYIMEKFWAVNNQGYRYKHGEYKLFKNGVLRTHTNYSMNRIHGQSIIYNESGYIHSITQYVNDSKHGLEQEFYPNGNIKLEVEYINDIQHGRYTKYFANKVVNFITHYVHGIRHGPFISHYPNGHVDIISTYNHGKLHGEFIKHYSYGSVQKKIMYNNGHTVSTRHNNPR